ATPGPATARTAAAPGRARLALRGVRLLGAGGLLARVGLGVSVLRQRIRRSGQGRHGSTRTG
ncbi:hypothetical protein ThrDRAFT_02264, partial [Frankia casuarinae]